MVWSYRITGRSQVDANDNIEVSIDILQDGEARIQNVPLSGAPGAMAALCENRVTAFAGAYEASVALPENNEVVDVITP